MNEKKSLTICYFGCYVPDYARHRVLIGGLRKNGCLVKECRTSFMRGFKKYAELYKKFKQNCQDVDAVLVAYPGHELVWFAKLLTRKPVFFDPIYSFYDSYVDDRALCRRGSIKSYFYFFWDWFCAWLADIVILECGTLIDYFVQKFKLPRKKFIKVVMSADDDALFPREVKKTNDKFIVHFHGTFIPFHGIEYIIKAAKLLEEHDIIFNIIGAGQASKKIEQLIKDLNVKNINYWGRRIPHNEVLDYIAQADVCLGFFGAGPRAQKVMTNKIFEAIAMKKPVITADLPVMREIYTDEENILFCRPEDPEDLAEKIMFLKRDSELRARIAAGGYKLFQEKLAPKIVTRAIIEAVETIKL